MREDIKERIEMIKRGEVPEGYKKTKVGIVPEEWEIKKIKDLCKLSSGSTPSRQLSDNFTGEILWITSGELKNKYIIDSNEKVSEDAVKNSNLTTYDVGTFVIAIYGLEAYGVRGTCSLVEKRCTISQACMAFTNLENIINEYLYYWYLKNGQIIGLRYAQGTKQQNLNMDVVYFLNILLPTIFEQKNIVNILSLYDKKIEFEQRLITEKQKQKKWLMQNLFTGKKRLKGFDDLWEKMHLGELLEECSLKNSNLKITNVKSVSNKQGFINQDEQFGKSVASQDLSNYKIVSYGDIAYNPSRINVGSIALYENDCMGVVSPMYVVMNTKKKLFNNYFMYFVETNEFKQKMKGLLSGSVRESLNFSDLCCMHIKLPSIQEQKAIAQILSQATKEIELLHQLLEQTKLEKKAMMQLLLTGIVRVNKKGGE